jgi:hypothetical protein
MPKTHSPYPPEFREQMVELVRAGRTPGELERGSDRIGRRQMTQSCCWRAVRTRQQPARSGRSASYPTSEFDVQEKT